MNADLNINKVGLMEKAASSLRDRSLIRLIVCYHCSICEVLALAVQDINFGAGMVTIRPLKIRLNLTCYFCNSRLRSSFVFCPVCGERVKEAVAEAKERYRQAKKRHRPRNVYLDQDTLKLLRHYISKGGSVVQQIKRLIFSISRRRTWQIIRKCVEKANSLQE